MGRVIRTENISTERNRLMKAMAIALRELGKQAGFNSVARDLAAFIVLALGKVAASIEASVLPWEKRDYWLKADRFRMDWAWAQPIAKQLRAALFTDDIGEVAASIAKLAEKLQSVDVSPKHRLGTPWVGAWEKLQSEESKTNGAHSH